MWAQNQAFGDGPLATHGDTVIFGMPFSMIQGTSRSPPHPLTPAILDEALPDSGNGIWGFPAIVMGLSQARWMVCTGKSV